MLFLPLYCYLHFFLLKCAIQHLQKRYHLLLFDLLCQLIPKLNQLQLLLHYLMCWMNLMLQKYYICKFLDNFLNHQYQSINHLLQVEYHLIVQLVLLQKIVDHLDQMKSSHLHNQSMLYRCALKYLLRQCLCYTIVDHLLVHYLVHLNLLYKIIFSSQLQLFHCLQLSLLNHLLVQYISCQLVLPNCCVSTISMSSTCTKSCVSQWST